MPSQDHDTNNPLALWPNEPTRANEALHDYWKMGTSRSQRALAELYEREQNDLEASSGRGGKSPTLKTIIRWSKVFKWTERVRLADELQIQESTNLAKAEYFASVEDFRTRTQKAGKQLFAVGMKQLAWIVRKQDEMGDSAKPADINMLTSAALKVSQTLHSAAEMEALGLGINRMQKGG